MTIITCPNCQAKNRVDERTAASKQPVCGRCGAKLELSAATNGTHPIEVTDSTFQQVLQSAGDKPILIDCWAEWCPPCKMLTPTIEALAKEANGRWVIGKLDVDHNPTVAGRFRVSSIPTMLIFKNGQLRDQLVGLQGKAAIELKLAAIR